MILKRDGVTRVKRASRHVSRHHGDSPTADTRGTINFGRNYTNNPVTNVGGSQAHMGMVYVLLGGAEGFRHEHALR